MTNKEAYHDEVHALSEEISTREREIRKKHPFKPGRDCPKELYEPLHALRKEEFERYKAIVEKYKSLDLSAEYEG